MAKIAVVSDTHFGARNDSPILQSFQKKFLDKVFFPTLDTYDIKQVIHAGDYGDRRKYWNVGTVRFVEEEYRAQLRWRDVHEHIIIGNHDCFLRDSTAINGPDELWSLDKTITVYSQPTEVEIEEVPFLFLPWICGNNRDASEKLIATSDIPYIVGHLELAGFQMYKGMPAHEGADASVYDRFQLVMTGHYHHRSSVPPVQYLGAMWPMIWSDYRDARGFHLFDTETHELEFIENPYSMFCRFVYDDHDKDTSYLEKMIAMIVQKGSPFHDAYVKIVVKSKTQPHWLDLVMDALAKVNAQDVAVIDDIISSDEDGDGEHVSMDIDTLTIIDEYVDGLTVNCDKSELKTYLRSVYSEAQALSQTSHE